MDNNLLDNYHIFEASNILKIRLRILIDKCIEDVGIYMWFIDNPAVL